MHLLLNRFLSIFHECPYSGGCRIELVDFVLLHHGPIPVVTWVEGRAFKLWNEWKSIIIVKTMSKNTAIWVKKTGLELSFSWENTQRKYVEWIRLFQ